MGEYEKRQWRKSRGGSRTGPTFGALPKEFIRTEDLMIRQNSPPISAKKKGVHRCTPFFRLISFQAVSVRIIDHLQRSQEALQFVAEVTFTLLVISNERDRIGVAIGLLC